MLRGKSHKQKPILENILLSNSILRLIKLDFNHISYLSIKIPKKFIVLNCRTFTRDIRTKPLRRFVVQKTFCMGEANGEITWIARIFQNSL